MDKEKQNGIKNDNEMSHAIIDEDLDKVSGGGPRRPIDEPLGTPNPLPSVGTKCFRANSPACPNGCHIFHTNRCVDGVIKY